MSLGSKITELEQEMNRLQRKLSKQTNQSIVSESEKKLYKPTTTIKQIATFFEASSDFFLDLSKVLTEVHDIISNHDFHNENEPKLTLIDKYTYNGKNIDKKIANILMTIGIPVQLRGYQFLRESIKIAIEQPDSINNITKNIYTYIAQKNNTAPKNVKQAISHAINVSYNSEKILNINDIFGTDIFKKNEKPSNSEIISLIAEKLLLDNI